MADAVIAGTGEQPEFAVACLAGRERFDSLHPGVVGSQEEPQHLLRLGAGGPLALHHRPLRSSPARTDSPGYSPFVFRVRPAHLPRGPPPSASGGGGGRSSPRGRNGPAAGTRRPRVGFAGGTWKNIGSWQSRCTPARNERSSTL